MSHSVCCVVLDPNSTLEEQLAPFSEDLEVPKYVKYTKQQLIDKGREKINHMKKVYRTYKKDPVKYRQGCANSAHLEYLENKFPLELKWTDEEIYQHEVEFYENKDKGSDGEVYSEYNPLSKWDWWVIGGRWGGYFKAKPGCSGELGDSSEKPKPGYFDIMKVKDIDFNYMKNEEFEKVLGWWNEAQKKLSIEKEEEHKNIRSLYNIKKGETRKKYLERRTGISTFSILKDGKWFEKGEMGWFGMSSNEKEDEIWEKEWWDIINSLDPETRIAIVDVHI